MSLDTGDQILVHGLRELVACAHDGLVWLCGPLKTVRAHDCTLVQAATPEQRQAQLEALASSSGTSHRAVCARRRLGDG